MSHRLVHFASIRLLEVGAGGGAFRIGLALALPNLVVEVGQKAAEGVQVKGGLGGALFAAEFLRDFRYGHASLSETLQSRFII